MAEGMPPQPPQGQPYATPQNVSPQGYPPPGYPPQQGYAQYPAVVVQQVATPGKATASLVLGILGMFLCPIVLSVLAIIFGIQARNMIDASGGALGGRGTATAGMVLGIVGMAVSTILFILSMSLGWYSTSSLLSCLSVLSLLP